MPHTPALLGTGLPDFLGVLQATHSPVSTRRRYDLASLRVQPGLFCMEFFYALHHILVITISDTLSISLDFQILEFEQFPESVSDPV